MSFFTALENKFLPVPEDGRIETVPFLKASAQVIPFFDALGSTAFMPVKSDINGNITKLTDKHKTNPEKFKTLQDIVESEIAEGTTKAKNSATDALLWLKRALEFIRVFLRCVLEGEEDLTVAANKAYEESLKRYHGWMVRGIFSLAVRAVPYRKDFIAALAKGDSGEEVVLRDMKEFMTVYSLTVDTIGKFYKEKGQDSDQAV